MYAETVETTITSSKIYKKEDELHEVLVHGPQDLEKLETAITLFNTIPEDGINFLIEHKLFWPKSSKTALLKVLLSASGVDKEVLSEFIMNSMLWREFFMLFDFMYRPLEASLRKMANVVLLPRAEDKRRAAIDSFAEIYSSQNAHQDPSIMANKLCVSELALLILDLNDKLPLSIPEPQEFCSFCTLAVQKALGEAASVDDYESLFFSIYSRITNDCFPVKPELTPNFAIKPSNENVYIKIEQAEKQGWLWVSEHVLHTQTKERCWTRLYCVFAEWVLYFFEGIPESNHYNQGAPYCIIPLQDSIPKLGHNAESIRLESNVGMKIFYPRKSLKGIIETKKFYLKADDLEKTDEWNSAFRHKAIQPTARAVAKFTEHVESTRRSTSPRQSKMQVGMGNIFNQKFCFQVLDPDSLHGFLFLKRKGQQFFYRRYCALVDNKIFYSKSEDMATRESKFLGFVDLEGLNKLESAVARGNGKYTIVLWDENDVRMCSINLETAKEFSLWLRSLTAAIEDLRSKGFESFLSEPELLTKEDTIHEEQSLLVRPSKPTVPPPVVPSEDVAGKNDPPRPTIPPPRPPPHEP